MAVMGFEENPRLTDLNAIACGTDQPKSGSEIVPARVQWKCGKRNLRAGFEAERQ